MTFLFLASSSNSRMTVSNIYIYISRSVETFFLFLMSPECVMCVCYLAVREKRE